MSPVVEIGSSQAPVAISKSTDHGAREICGPFNVTEILPASPATGVLTQNLKPFRENLREPWENLLTLQIPAPPIHRCRR